MLEINLLPWRENQRLQEKNSFFYLLVIVFFISLSFIGFSNFYVKKLIAHQLQENQQLKKEIILLDNQFKEINNLKLTSKKFIEQISLLRQFQLTNLLAIHLLDELANLISDEIYLQKVIKKDNKVTLVGYVRTSRQIHTLIRNLDESPWIEEPFLESIRKVKKNNLHEFKLNLTLKTKIG